MDSLRIYDKDIQEKFPNKNINKHIDMGKLNEKINEFIENGDHALGVELIRYYHWQLALCKEARRIISEQTIRYAHYESMETEIDFNIMQKITWDKMKVDLFNKLFFIFQEQDSITKNEFKNLLNVITLP